jgi:4'-phosphopantetheinyl transferase
MTLLELGETRCDVWIARQPEKLDPVAERTWQGWLSAEETRRYHAFHFEKHRVQYLLTRALVRTTLSRYTGTTPRAWRFVDNAHGKPAIAEPLPTTPLAFNLSNTEGVVLCAVTRGFDIGVDVEAVDRAGETVSIADNFFSSREAAELRALPIDRQRARFFDYWTLKEAYIKARGLGLAIPLDQFTFLLREDSPAIEIVFDPKLGDDASAWQFARLELGTAHAAAIAIRRGPAPDLALALHEVEPPARAP